MSKEILINSTEDEIRIAIIKDGALSNIFIERTSEEKFYGNIYSGRIDSIVEGLGACFTNIGIGKNGYLPFSEVAIPRQELHKKKIILVQISKEAIGSKGVKLTQRISLPGRYLVYLPTEEHIGISKNITDEKERDRLRKIIENLKINSGGFIVRSEAEGLKEGDLKKEVKYLSDLWGTIKKRFSGVNTPQLIHKDLELIFKIVRDYFSEEVDILLVDSQQIYEDILGFVELIQPILKEKIRIYAGKTPIFSAYKIEEEIEKLLRQKIKLPSGGYIIIQEAETLCAIDVNSGKFVKGKSPEHINFITNLEAVKEIARQIRLRDIGGIIVIDFIDMKTRENRKRVYEEIKNAVKEDKAKIKILPITKLGLIEMTRERRSESFVSKITEECNCCDGSGKILSRETMFLKIKKEIIKIVTKPTVSEIKIKLNTDIFEYFTPERVETIEKIINRKIKIEPDSKIHREDYRIVIT